MTHPYDELTLSGNSLLFTPCPGTKGVSVAESLQQLQQAGASAVVTLTPAAELAKLNIEGLAEQCQALGLQWFHCPIEDDCAPAADFTAAWQQAAPQLQQLLDQQQKIAIHCKGGSGRTSLAAAQLLVERGIDKAEIMAKIRELRPHALTLTPHVDYFNALSSANPITGHQDDN
ncbi:phosphatase domain-containing putative toxin [Alishewanella longhuensis]